MITIKQDKPRTCPYCGSDDIELIVMSFDKNDTIMQLYLQCEKCKKTFMVHYEIKYKGTNYTKEEK